MLEGQNAGLWGWGQWRARYTVGCEKIRELNIWKMSLFQVKMGLKPSGWEFKHKKSDGNLAFAMS